MMTAARIAGVGIAALAVVCPGALPWAASTIEPDAPYVDTPPAVVEAMLDLAEVGPRDFVIDLGSGDGRIVIMAATKRGARGLGVDIDGDLVSAARREARRQGVADRVTFVEENLFVTDLRRASVLTLYLHSGVLAQLRPRLFSDLRPGTRIVSHDFGISGWKPDRDIVVPAPGKIYGPPRSDVYLWIVPANAAGTWRWRGVLGGRPAEGELSLTQNFQMLTGRAVIGGVAARVEGGRMRGDAIRLVIGSGAKGRLPRHEFDGRVEGDAIRGTVTIAGTAQDWQATRTQRGTITLIGDH